MLVSLQKMTSFFSLAVYNKKKQFIKQYREFTLRMSLQILQRNEVVLNLTSGILDSPSTSQKFGRESTPPAHYHPLRFSCHYSVCVYIFKCVYLTHTQLHTQALFSHQQYLCILYSTYLLSNFH